MRYTVQVDRRSFLKNRAWCRGGGQAGWTLPTPHWSCPSMNWVKPSLLQGCPLSQRALSSGIFYRLLWNTPGRKTLVIIYWLLPFSHQSHSRIPRAPHLEKVCRVAKPHSQFELWQKLWPDLLLAGQDTTRPARSCWAGSQRLNHTTDRLSMHKHECRSVHRRTSFVRAFFDDDDDDDDSKIHVT